MVAFLVSGLVGNSVSRKIEIKDIADMKICTIPPFFPFGILITMKNGDKYKLSFMKRKKYVEMISTYMDK